MKRTPLKRSGFKKKPTKPLKKTPLKKVSKAKVSTLRNKCDALLTPIIKQLFPKCLLCGEPTQVAHHHVHKATSTRLRYELDNLINLCHPCHRNLHNNESYFASKIIKIKGIEWFSNLEKKKNELVKANREFYQSHLERLTNLLKAN